MFMVFNSPNVFQNLEEINNRNMFIVFNSPNINPNNLNIYL